jgi:hypothetical protein
VFCSLPGCGKGALNAFLKGVLGSKNIAVIIRVDRYFGNNFNSHTSMKLLKIFEEMQDNGSGVRFKDRIKGEITSDVEELERKNQDVLSVRHCSRFFFNTNNKNSMYVDPHCRRYTIHMMNGKFADNQEYFAPIWEEIENPDFLKCAFDFLKNREYSTAAVRKCFSNQNKLDQKLSSLPSGLKFIKSFVEERFAGPTNHKAGDTGFDYRFRCADIKELFKQEGGKPSSLMTQLKHLNIMTKKGKIDSLSGSTTFVLLNPIDIENSFKQYLKDDEFKLDFKIEEDPEEQQPDDDLLDL